MVEECKDCKFFWTYRNGGGSCRRFPPKRGEAKMFSDPGDQFYSYWPIVGEDDWCGEFLIITSMKLG